MKWRLQLAVVLGLSVSSVATFAQGPPEAERLSSSRSSPQPDNVFSLGGMVQFQLIQGRLSLDPSKYRKGVLQCVGANFFEKVTVSADHGLPTLQYVRKYHGKELFLTVENATAVRVESILSTSTIGQPSTCILVQPELGAIHWTVTEHLAGVPVVTKFSGATLYHLREQNTKVFDQHFAELTDQILVGRSIATLCEQSHHQLLNEIQKTPIVDRNSVQQCVDRLASPQQSIRRKAFRELISSGTPVLPILEEQLMIDLDREQQTRVQQVVRTLRSMTQDTPRSVAMLLLNDRKYWAITQRRLSIADQIVVNDYLENAGLKKRENILEIASRPE